MQNAINSANEKAIAVLHGHTTIDPRSVTEGLAESLTKEFGGWQVTKIGKTKVAVPRDPENLIRQAPIHQQEDLRGLLAAPHFKIGRKWYLMDPPRYPIDDLWGVDVSTLALYTRERVGIDRERKHCAECEELDENCERHVDWPRPMIPGRDAREVWDDDYWFNTVLMTFRDTLRMGILVLPD